MTRTVGICVLGVCRHHTKVIEACQFLASVVSGEQGQPGFREALAVARVQEAIMRSWESELWVPVACEE
jgi:hypothetical protein